MNVGPVMASGHVTNTPHLAHVSLLVFTEPRDALVWKRPRRIYPPGPRVYNQR